MNLEGLIKECQILSQRGPALEADIKQYMNLRQSYFQAGMEFQKLQAEEGQLIGELQDLQKQIHAITEKVTKWMTSHKDLNLTIERAQQITANELAARKKKVLETCNKVNEYNKILKDLQDIKLQLIRPTHSALIS